MMYVSFFKFGLGSFGVLMDVKRLPLRDSNNVADGLVLQMCRQYVGVISAQKTHA